MDLYRTLETVLTVELKETSRRMSFSDRKTSRVQSSKKDEKFSSEEFTNALLMKKILKDKVESEYQHSETVTVQTPQRRSNLDHSPQANYGGPCRMGTTTISSIDVSDDR
jgi:hypothetical protein